MELPQKYLDSMKELLGDEFQAYLDSFSQKRLYGLRVNNLKISTEDFLKISPFKLKKIPWIDNGFYYEEEDKPAKHPYYFAGLYYLQEPSAMTPASILPIEHGDKVLDVCAAPGGKSTELGARLGGTGLLVSNDISASRAKALLKNIEVSGIGNVVITCEEPGKLISSFESFFDKILIDAPCSGEGMFRKDNKLIKSWQMNGPEYFAAIQKSILSQAAQMLKPGGYMLYSTCTFSKLEDEDNIHLFLESHPDFSLVDIFDSGIPSIHPYEGFSKGIGLPQCVRIFPHKMHGEGHFVALLKKDGEAIQDSPVHGRPNKLPDELTAFLDEPDLTDEMYEKASMHNENGAWQMIFGVNTLPEYRRHGHAGELIRYAINDAKTQGRAGLVLTCKQKLIPYYARFGFVDEGVSDKSTHGNAVWHQMRLAFR